jgi:hypothetical protein
LRTAIAEIFTSLVPLVTFGAPATTATSCEPRPFSLYRRATWSAIALVIFAVEPDAGFQDDQAGAASGPFCRIRTTAPTIAPTSVRPRTA